MHFVRDILFFFLKQLFTGYAEDRQTRFRLLTNVTAYGKALCLKAMNRK